MELKLAYRRQEEFRWQEYRQSYKVHWHAVLGEGVALDHIERSDSLLEQGLFYHICSHIGERVGQDRDKDSHEECVRKDRIDQHERGANMRVKKGSDLEAHC